MRNLTVKKDDDKIKDDRIKYIQGKLQEAFPCPGGPGVS